MKEKRVVLLGILLAAIGMLFKDSEMSLWDYSLMLVFGHTIWIQSSIGYNILPGRKTNIFFGWGHHLPIHDPIKILGVQWVKDFHIYEPDGKVIQQKISEDIEEGHFPYFSYECKKEGTYRLASYVPTGYYSIYLDKDDNWHHYVKPLDTLDQEKEVKKMLISLKYWEWTKAIMTVGKPDDNALKPVGQEMEIMLDKNPVEYRSGDTVHFTVLKGGNPLTEPGGSFYAQDQGHSPGFDDFVYDAVPLNEDGTGSFEITRPAVWYLKVHWGYPAPKEYEDKCWIFGYMVSLTFEVDTDAGVKNPSYNL
ncbi:MAG: DUF4198 domain-containing protein [Deltaproteobacteria bacterium]|nr:DUF4198 domain-containing protein [Deltaproteobacteria bacterium]